MKLRIKWSIFCRLRRIYISALSVDDRMNIQRSTAGLDPKCVTRTSWCTTSPTDWVVILQRTYRTASLFSAGGGERDYSSYLSYTSRCWVLVSTLDISDLVLLACVKTANEPERANYEQICTACFATDFGCALQHGSPPTAKLCYKLYNLFVQWTKSSFARSYIFDEL